MQSSYIPPQQEESKESPQQIMLQCLTKKNLVQQAITRLEDASKQLDTMTQEQQRLLLSEYQHSQQTMQALDQTIHRLVNHDPSLQSLISVASLPTGQMTGDHVPQSGPNSSSSITSPSTSSSYQNSLVFFSDPSMTFNPGVKSSSSKPSSRERVTKKR